MRIILFGGSGFIGRNIIEQLGDKYDIIAPTRQEMDIEKDRHLSADVDAVINCVNAEDNLQAYFNIVALYSGKLIHLGSGAEYDKSNHIRNIREEDFGIIPKDPYGLGKFYISNHIDWRDNTVCLRPFGVFGKYEDYKRRFISKAILDNMKGQNITVYKNQKFSYIWVNDLVKIIDYFINNEAKHKFYNVGGHKTTLKKIAKKIGRYKVINRGWANEYTCNDERVRKETGIIYTPFKESLKELRKFYESSIK